MNLLKQITLLLISIIASSHELYRATVTAEAAIKQLDAFESEFLESLAGVESSDGGGGGGASATGSTGGHCEPIATGGFCSKVNNYNLTRMPNFFQDLNQLQALERAANLEDLARTRCSDYIQNYLCELITPICLDGMAMRKFEIYPCRSVCRQIVLDCRDQIVQLYSQLDSINLAHSNLPMPIGFQCDQLPYEANGADGPCHELKEMQPNRWFASYPQMPILQQHQQQQQPSAAATTEPIATTTATTQKPYHPFSKHPNLSNNNINPRENHQQNVLLKVGQYVLWFLTEYSNLLSIITVIMLLIMLNLKRISRARQNRPSIGRCWSLSSGSSSSTSSGKRVLTPMDQQQQNFNHLHQNQLARHLHQVTLHSPNSSSLSSSSALKHHLYPLASDRSNQSPLLGPHCLTLSPNSSTRILAAGQDPKLTRHFSPRQQHRPLNYSPGSNLSSAASTSGSSSSPTALTTGPATPSARSKKHHLLPLASTCPMNPNLYHQAQANHHYDYVEVVSSPRNAAAASTTNILLSSPSRQVVLGGSGNRPTEAHRPRA